MAVEDYIEPQVGVAVAATALVFSPRVRTWLRRGAVYAVAGALVAGDKISSATGDAGRGIQETASSAADTVEGAAGKARAGTRGKGREVR